MTIARRSPLSLLLILALIVAVIAVATMPALRDIPFTNHAKDGHIGQAWTAAGIQARLASRSCSPIKAYSCPRQMIVICPVGNPADLWTGLIIGTATGEAVIVTGYAAPRSYWEKRVSGCLLTSYVP